jgi:hypothetical protein
LQHCRSGWMIWFILKLSLFLREKNNSAIELDIRFYLWADFIQQINNDIFATNRTIITEP